MINTKLTFKLNKNYLYALIVLILLNMPGFLIEITTIYHTEHAYALGGFAKLSYNFTIFDCILCIWGIFAYRKRYMTVNIYPILGLVLLKDFFLFLLGNVSPFSLNSWEMYLSACIGMSCCAIVGSCFHDNGGIDRFMDWLIIFNFIYQLLFLLTGRVSASGRVTVMSQGYGSVGYMCALNILYLLIVKEQNRGTMVLVIISVLSIILSGSRFSLLLVILGILIFSKYILKSASRKMRMTIFLALSIVGLGLVAIIFLPDLQEKYEILKRMANLFQGNILNNVAEDESFIQRVESIVAGGAILSERPIGISNSFIDLQGCTIEQGFFAFPHSTLMAYYLLWGPVFIFCIYWIVKKIICAVKKNEDGCKYFLILMLIIFTVYGGIETAPKVYTYVFCLFSAVNERLSSKKITGKN